MKKLRIAVDMDEVIADTLDAQCHWVNTHYGYDLARDKIGSGGLRTILHQDHFTALNRRLHQGEIFRDISVMNDSQRVLRRLVEQSDIFIVTAAMEYPRSMQFKFDWLREHFNFIDPLNYVFCGDKSIVAADYLIDDTARHFSRFPGQGVLFSAPHNALETNFSRIDAWSEALATLRSLGADVVD